MKHYLKLNKKVLKYPQVEKAISKIKPINYKNHFNMLIKKILIQNMIDINLLYEENIKIINKV